MSCAMHSPKEPLHFLNTVHMDGNVVYMYETLTMNASDCVVCMSSLYAYVHACVSIYMYNADVVTCITCMAVCTSVYLCIRVV